MLLSACATAPDRIEPLDVPPDRYLGSTCAQLQAERDAVARRIIDLRHGIESANSITEGATAIVAWWVFWPELLYHRATVAPRNKAEYARLLGEDRTIAQVLAAKHCPERQPPDPAQASPPGPGASGPRP